jgi:uncharacterized damage-inducible protein DinB
MTTTELLLNEMQHEAETTRKMLARIPDDKYDWRPHEKSMTMRRLATHIADIPSWVDIAINDDELDFASGSHTEPVINNTAELLNFLEESIAKGGAALKKADDELLEKEWTLRNGAQVLSVRPKRDVVRMAYCQIVHHRAQLGVYLRLLNVPIPGSYGPSADEMPFN